MEHLSDIFSRYKSDKSAEFHNYARQYDELWRKYRDLPIRILEIGVFRGESLKIMRDAFPNALAIVGIDIDANCKVYENTERSIFVEVGDSSSDTFLRSVVDKYGPFDFILDDGSHINEHVIKAFECLFPLLKDDGLYLVEDTVCFKSQPHINSNYPNHLTYFVQFTAFINQWRYDSTEGVRDNCIDPFKIMKKTNNPIEQGIDKIEFGCSYIAIHKLIRPHWIP